MPTLWQPGMDITAERLNADLFVRKGSDTSRDTTTTRTDDPHLTVSVAANATYLVDGFIIYSATTTTDLSVAWAIPSGASGAWCAWCIGNDATGTSTNGYTVRTEARTDLTQGHTCGGIGSPNLVSALVKATLVTSSAGTFALQWAQATSGGVAATVYANSWLRLIRVA